MYYGIWLCSKGIIFFSTWQIFHFWNNVLKEGFFYVSLCTTLPHLSKTVSNLTAQEDNITYRIWMRTKECYRFTSSMRTMQMAEGMHICSIRTPKRIGANFDKFLDWGSFLNHGQLARWIKWRACDLGEAKEGLENEMWRRWLHLRHNSFSNPSVALPTSQLILQPFRSFIYVTVHSSILLSLLLRHNLFI